MSWMTRYQYHTNVNYLTCEACLSWHGAIRRDPSRFPDTGDACERVILPFSWRERKFYREKGRSMRAAAKAERARRRLFEAGSDALPRNPDEALEAFRSAVGIDVYIPDIERLVERHGPTLEDDPALRESLRALFAQAYSDKFGWRRYELLPERMRLAREQAGIARINELLR